MVCFCSSWYEKSQVVDGLPVAETAFSMLFGVFQATTMSEDEFIEPQNQNKEIAVCLFKKKYGFYKAILRESDAF